MILGSCAAQVGESGRSGCKHGTVDAPFVCGRPGVLRHWGAAPLAVWVQANVPALPASRLSMRSSEPTAARRTVVGTMYSSNPWMTHDTAKRPWIGRVPVVLTRLSRGRSAGRAGSAARRRWCPPGFGPPVASTRPVGPFFIGSLLSAAVDIAILLPSPAPAPIRATEHRRSGSRPVRQRTDASSLQAHLEVPQTREGRNTMPRSAPDAPIASGRPDGRLPCLPVTVARVPVNRDPPRRAEA